MSRLSVKLQTLQRAGVPWPKLAIPLLFCVLACGMPDLVPETQKGSQIHIVMVPDQSTKDTFTRVFYFVEVVVRPISIGSERRKRGGNARLEWYSLLPVEFPLVCMT